MIQVITADAGYKTPWIAKQIFEDGRIPSLPYKRPMTKKAFTQNTNTFMMHTTTGSSVPTIKPYTTAPPIGRVIKSTKAFPSTVNSVRTKNAGGVRKAKPLKRQLTGISGKITLKELRMSGIPRLERRAMRFGVKPPLGFLPMPRKNTRCVILFTEV